VAVINCANKNVILISALYITVCLPLWKFLDYVVTHRPSIFLMLQPFIQFKVKYLF